jgi:hypothetical protein
MRDRDVYACNINLRRPRAAKSEITSHLPIPLKDRWIPSARRLGSPINPVPLP